MIDELLADARDRMGKSVESINATVFSNLHASSSMGPSKCSFTARSPPSFMRARNRLSILTSGTLNRLGSRAKDLQERSSGSDSSSRLNEWTGVSKASKLTRNNCAGENRHGLPGPRQTGKSELIRSSGM